MKNKLKLVKLFTALPRALCDINAENNEGVRPIHLAAKRGTLGVVCHLVNCGCDITAEDKSGKTPLDYCERDDVKNFLNHTMYGTPYVLGESRGEIYTII